MCAWSSAPPDFFLRLQHYGVVTETLSLPTDGGSGLMPGVDLDNNRRIAELLEDQEPCDEDPHAPA